MISGDIILIYKRWGGAESGNIGDGFLYFLIGWIHGQVKIFRNDVPTKTPHRNSLFFIRHIYNSYRDLRTFLTFKEIKGQV